MVWPVAGVERMGLQAGPTIPDTITGLCPYYTTHFR